VNTHDAIFQYIDDHFDEHLEATRRLVQQRSISLENEGVRECADMLLGMIQDLGTRRAELVEFEDGFPLVYGELWSNNPAAKTLIVYCLYDVMPVVDEVWVTPPFAAEIVEPQKAGLPGYYGPCLVGRGSSNHKGPLMCVINALRSIKAVTGDIPVNVIFAVEGEEEITSPHMEEFRDRYLEELGQADAAYLPNPYQDDRGRSQIHLGTKGIVAFELRVRGGDWGGPAERALFSTDSIWVDAPAWHLVRALDSMIDATDRVQIEGFYDNLRPLTAAEQEQLDRLKANFDEEATKRRLGIRRFRGGCLGSEYFEEFTAGPVLNIDGYRSGYIGPYIKTMFPDSAVAKLDIRLVPDMEKEDIKGKLRKHLDTHGFSHVELWFQGSYSWSKTDLSADIVQAAITAVETHGVEPAIWPTAYYAAPMAVFNRPPLNLPCTDAGIGYMGRWHEANEFFAVDSMHNFEKWVVTFLHEFAQRG
jgi:acetylornithine deacetylase/succinyl-diaminopimelate desuccinylase-like protein